MNGLERSPYGFVLKAIMVEPDASAPGFAADPGGAVGGQPQPGVVRPPPRPRFNTAPPPRPAPGGAAVVRPPVNDKPIHVLKEKRLKVTMLVYAIKPAK